MPAAGTTPPVKVQPLPTEHRASRSLQEEADTEAHLSIGEVHQSARECCNGPRVGGVLMSSGRFLRVHAEELAGALVQVGPHTTTPEGGRMTVGSNLLQGVPAGMRSLQSQQTGAEPCLVWVVILSSYPTL